MAETRKLAAILAADVAGYSKPSRFSGLPGHQAAKRTSGHLWGSGSASERTAQALALTPPKPLQALDFPASFSGLRGVPQGFGRRAKRTSGHLWGSGSASE
jgi:hypothetical protein